MSHYVSSFRAYLEGLESARALLEDLSFALRDFTDGLEFSPERLAELESPLAELSRLERKDGGTTESALEHLSRSTERLDQIERGDERETELRAELDAARRD